MEVVNIKIKFPENSNIILGQAHFIKSVEDLHEAIVNSVPDAKFGIAFSEASGEKLIRWSGTDEEAIKYAISIVKDVSSGHFFAIVLKNCYPINVLNSIKNVPEVCNIFCATSNPVEVVVARGDGKNGVLGVIDGESPSGVEGEKDIEKRKRFLRDIGYKL